MKDSHGKKECLLGGSELSATLIRTMVKHKLICVVNNSALVRLQESVIILICRFNDQWHALIERMQLVIFKPRQVFLQRYRALSTVADHVGAYFILIANPHLQKRKNKLHLANISIRPDVEETR